MLYRAAITLIFSGLLAQAALAAPQEVFRCSWHLDSTGRDKLNFENAPAGLKRYIVRTSGRDGVHGVMDALEAAGLAASEFKGVRELSSMGGMLVTSFTPKALNWLCSQQVLDKFILGVELDQQIKADSDAHEGRKGTRIRDLCDNYDGRRLDHVLYIDAPLPSQMALESPQVRESSSRISQPFDAIGQAASSRRK